MRSPLPVWLALRAVALLAALFAALFAAGCRSPGGASAPDASDGFLTLFDGHSARGWKHAGSGRFVVEGGVARAEGGKGLWYFAARQFGDFDLEVEYRVPDRATNSGVFVRVTDVDAALGSPSRDGYEVQIHGDDASAYATGAIYSFAAPTAPPPLRPPGQWNTMVVRAVGHDYQVALNGTVVTRYRGKRQLAGMVGLQNQSGDDRIEFRRVRIRPHRASAPAM